MNLLSQIAAKIKSALAEAALEARKRGEVKFDRLPEFTVEVPRERDHGDLATNLALVLARGAGRPPREVADSVLCHLNLTGTWVHRTEVAGPGFINFWLDPSWLYQVPGLVEAQGDRWGNSHLGAGVKVQVEFVSANPTGLLHMGNARGAALGDTLANLLAAAGYEVTREYYINDAGHQIETFALSLEARYLQLFGREAPLPEEGYHGEDLVDTVRDFAARYGDRYLTSPPEERRQALVDFALQEKLAGIRRSLERFGVRYDVWFSEQSLHSRGLVGDTLAELERRGYLYRQDGAVWFRASALAKAKDEVVVRSSGVPTYFAADIAYHVDKFARGFDRVINIWGADHHGHVGRLKAALAALGYDPERLTVILMQLVRLFQGGELLRMSKRTGQYVTLDELLDEVGKDAARYFFLLRSADSHLDFDLDLAKSQSEENPVYYVQYAHARIASILRHARAEGYEVPPAGAANLRLLTHPAEVELLRKIAEWPGVVETAARNLEPHRLPYYAHELASIFHRFYTQCRVLHPDPELRGARLVLVKITRITLARVLNLMGVTAPESM
ncbi:MAG: arginine--tRNA ligase [Moorellales bacterium]